MMKILQETASSQTLKVIPRSYPSIVDVVITNEDTKTSVTYEDLTASSNLGYLEIDNFFGTTDGVKFISANNEYISSPDQNYLGNDITGLDIEIRYSDLDTSGFIWYFVAQGNSNPLLDDNIYISSDTSNVIEIAIAGNVVNYDFTTEYGSFPTEGTIKINSDGVDINFLFNDVNLVTQSVTNTDLSNISGNLGFGVLYALGFAGVWSNFTTPYIKLNDHVWNFSEGSGSTTTNSQGVISTLNSDVSTDAMWINTSGLEEDTFYSFEVWDLDAGEQNEIIYKGKIFCTNQTDYSINDGEYTTRSRNNKYTTYE